MEFTKFVRRLVLAFLLIVLGCALRSDAQNAGVVGIATKEISVFSAQSTTASSGGVWQCSGSTSPIPCPVLPDIGSGCNVLNYQTAAFTGTITLEWSKLASPYTPIVLAVASFPGANPDTAVHTLQVGGYYPNLRSTATPTAGSISAQYTAQATSCPFIAPGIGSNGPTSPIACDRNNIQAVGTGSTLSIAAIGPIFTGDVVVICSFTISFSAATTGGAVGIEWAASTGACSSAPTGPTWNSYVTASTPQSFTVQMQQRSFGAAADPYPCFTNSSGAPALIAVSYASVHGV